MALEFVKKAVQTGKANVQSGITFVKHPALGRLVSDDDKPTPGYIYDDVARLTWISDEASHDVLFFLLNHLEKDSANVRLKALRALRFLIPKGHEGFQREFQLHTDSLRACAQFRGTLDPVHGDSLNRQVREVAADLLRVVFEDPKSVKRERPRTLDEGNSSVGFGSSNSGGFQRSNSYAPPNTVVSSSASGGTADPTYGTGKQMWGYGNPNYSSQAPSSSSDSLSKIKGVLVNAVNAVSTPTAPPAFATARQTSSSNYSSSNSNSSSNNSYSSNAYGGSSSYGGRVGSSGAPAPRSTLGSGALPNSYKPQALAPVAPGGGWGTADPEPVRASSAPANGRHALSTEAAAAVAEEPVQEEVASPATPPEESLEYKLVDDIAGPTGARATPPREALQEFCNRIRTLKLALIVQRLVEKLERGNTQEVLKALCVVEAMMVEEVPGGHGAAQGISFAIRPLMHSTKPAIKSKAEKILLLVGEDDQAEQRAQAEAAEEEAEYYRQQEAFQQQQQLFVEQQQSAQQQHQSAQQQHQSAPAQQPDDESDLFEGMSIADPQQLQPTSHVIPSQPPRSAVDDLLLDFGTSSTTVSQPSGGHAFSDMDDLLAPTTAAPPVQTMTAQQLAQQLMQPAGSYGQMGGAPHMGMGSVAMGSVAMGAPMGSAQQQMMFQQQQQQQQMFLQQQMYLQQQQQMMMLQQQQQAGVLANASMVGRGAVAGPNYHVTTTVTPSGSSQKEKKSDAFDFVKQELKK